MFVCDPCGIAQSSWKLSEKTSLSFVLKFNSLGNQITFKNSSTQLKNILRHRIEDCGKLFLNEKPFERKRKRPGTVFTNDIMQN